MDSINVHSGEDRRRVLNNQAGNILPAFATSDPNLQIPAEPLKLRCSNVFRELVIKYDGSCTSCCMDWKRELIMGKFPETSLKDIWNSDKFNSVRQLLYDKKRIMDPCRRCNYRGFRNGLVDDPELNLSDDELLKIIHS